MNHHPLRAMPQTSARVRDLHAQMTLEEKLAQIVGYWIDQGGNVVAPMQGEMAAGQKPSSKLAEITADGIGHYTRVYGTRPVDAAERAAWLWAEQRRLKRETRLGIPALVHEECLTGLATWRAATFPTPLAWGASFDPDLVSDVARAIGDSMRQLGIHVGLAPVLDVIRDPRWGRVEEAIGEDPYLVGTIGTAYIRGLQDAGVHATAKHFLGYSASVAGRNHAPVAAGPREVRDVLLPPFEMAILDGGVRSVMNSYTDIDGIPVAAAPEYLTGVLREQLGFTGTVLADYFSVAFLEVMHHVAADRAEAAALALAAGMDVELPTGDAFLEPLAKAVRAGEVDVALVDRAVLRALAQKEGLGLLDPAAYEDEPPAAIDLDSPRHRDLARRLAAESVVLLSNNGILPLGPQLQRVAVIGPNAHRTEALQGCYSFTNHVLVHFPDVEPGFEAPTVLDGLRAVFNGGPEVVFEPGCAVEDVDTSGFAPAIAAAAGADAAVVVVGDWAGLFGRGTVGEGNDAPSLDLPGVQRELVEAVVATGTPVVMVAITGRPYAIDWALDGPGIRPAGVVQAFFPGECGGQAIADILVGKTNPSGRLPVSLPRSAGAQPYSYLHPVLGGPTDVTVADPTPVRPFGFGLSYTSFEYSGLVVDDAVGAGGTFTARVRVTNSGTVAGSDVVQLYGHDPVGTIVRPVAQLLGYTRVSLEAGETATVSFQVPTTRFAFTGQDMVKIVEPGDVEVWVGAHAEASADDGTSDNATGDTTGGAIRNDRRTARRKIPGTATPRARMAITGPVHEVTTADSRMVTSHIGV